MSKSTSKQQSSFRNSPFYFDDCHICATVGKAEETGQSLSVEELREAFAEARTKQKKNKL